MTSAIKSRPNRIIILLLVLAHITTTLSTYLYAEEPLKKLAHKPDRVEPVNLELTKTAYSRDTAAFDVRAIVDGLLATKDPATGLVPSHFGHPGYENLCFLYDISVTALILYAAGNQAEAESILDYFSAKLAIPMDKLLASIDTNGIYGVIKVLDSDRLEHKKTKALINAIDIGASGTHGRGLLEFYTTPGPLAFIIFAMLQVNSERYKAAALELGETLLGMQNADGGIRDGDRAIDRVHTEPNMDCFAAFLMLYSVSGDKRWLDAANRAYTWFETYAYNKDVGTIYQGLWQKRPSKIFATDVYSWTMAGPAGDRLSGEELKALTDTMLEKCLTRVTLELPDGEHKTLILADFSDATDSRVMNTRRGLHPMGTVEWTGGVILALQKNAVRLWNAGDRETAKRYKALAQVLLKESSRAFYRLDTPDIITTFYATAQGLEIAPFGAIQNKSTNGWLTTYYYVKRAKGSDIKGGASIGAWPLLPYLGVNPFILHDMYKRTYDTIPFDDKSFASALQELTAVAEKRAYTEETPGKAPDRRVQIVEPRMFNMKMWDGIIAGYESKKEGGAAQTRRGFTDALFWASKVVQNPVWVELARSDNEIKAREVGGVLYYPWGMTAVGNEHPLHVAIQRYPLLNEMGTAMWGMATASYELGLKNDAKKWMARIIDEVPLHQIAAVDNANHNLVIGYWNALTSWEERSLSTAPDPGIYELYKKVLSEKGLASAKPPIIMSTEKLEELRSDMSILQESDENKSGN